MLYIILHVFYQISPVNIMQQMIDIINDSPICSAISCNVLIDNTRLTWLAHVIRDQLITYVMSCDRIMLSLLKLWQ